MAWSIRSFRDGNSQRMVKAVAPSAEGHALGFGDMLPYGITETALPGRSYILRRGVA